MWGVEMDNLARVLEDDEKFIALLKIIQSFELKDCWLCAGTIRIIFGMFLAEKRALVTLTFQM